MTLKEYVFELKDRLMLQHGTYAAGAISDHDDGFHTNEMLKRDIHDAIKKVVIEARLYIRSWDLALVANQYEYGFPFRCLKINNITHTQSSTQTQLRYVDYTRFIDGFSTTNTGTNPIIWSIVETKAEVHRFWDSTADDYVSTSTITSSSALNHIYDSDANYGVIESGKYPEVDDVVWLDTDGSYANIWYFDMETTVVTVTASGGSATTLTTADIITSAVEGHLVYNTTDSGSWGFIKEINTTTGVVTVDKWHGGTTGYPSNLDSCKIGIANHIYLKSMNPFTTRAFVQGADNTPTAGDTYRMQDKFETVPTIVLFPVPSTTDSTGTESLTIWGSAEATEMVEDNDPAPIPDVWSDYVLDFAYILALKRQPEKLGEIDTLELMYKDKIAKMKRSSAIQQLGEADNIYNNINPATTGVNLYINY
jgi:hypothetical protein